MNLDQIVEKLVSIQDAINQDDIISAKIELENALNSLSGSEFEMCYDELDLAYPS